MSLKPWLQLQTLNTLHPEAQQHDVVRASSNLQSLGRATQGLRHVPSTLYVTPDPCSTELSPCGQLPSPRFWPRHTRGSHCTHNRLAKASFSPLPTRHHNSLYAASVLPVSVPPAVPLLALALAALSATLIPSQRLPSAAQLYLKSRVSGEDGYKNNGLWQSRGTATHW